MILRDRGLVLSVAAALLFAGTAPARAQEHAETVDASAARPEHQRSQELLREGNDLFRGDRFAEALRAYREAYQRFPSPKLFFNIARCEESLGHRPQAMVNMRAFVKQAVDADPAVRADAEQRIAELKRALAGVDGSALPANAAVSFDGQSVGLTPFGDLLWLEPGAHRVAVERAGKPLWVTTVEGRAGETLALNIPEPMSETPQTPPAGGPEGTSPPQPAAAPRSRWWIWVGLGVLVAGATATVLALKLRCQQTQCE